MSRRTRVLLLGGLVALAGPPPAECQQRPVFGAQVETVYVDAFVTRKGRHVPGLTAADFELKDNGVREALEMVASESVPLLSVLVFDVSGSVSGEKLAALRASGKAFLESLRPLDEAALVTFSEEIEWRAGPTTDRGQVGAALDDLGAGGATAALDALFAGLVLPPGRARTLVLLFSDGEDNMSWLGEQELRAVAEGSNALLHAVSVREAAPPPWLAGTRGPYPQSEHAGSLRSLAEATGGRLWEAESPDKIRTAFAAIAEAMNQRYVLRYEPRGVKRPGPHKIDLRLKGKDGDVHARRGYWVGRR
jgi:VWFA-related protein